MRSLIIKWEKIAKESSPILNGLLLAIGDSVAVRVLHQLIPGLMNKASSDIVIPVLLGLFIKNVVGVSKSCEVGSKFALEQLLRLGIILLGLRLSIQEGASSGGAAMLLVLTCIAVALSTAYIRGGSQHRRCRYHTFQFDCSHHLLDHRTLPGIEPTRLASCGHTAVNAPSQVVAVGSTHSQTALNVATIVKLTRNTIMAPLIILIGLLLNNNPPSDGFSPSTVSYGVILIPWFVIGSLVHTRLCGDGECRAANNP